MARGTQRESTADHTARRCPRWRRGSALPAAKRELVNGLWQCSQHHGRPGDASSSRHALCLPQQSPGALKVLCVRPQLLLRKLLAGWHFVLLLGVANKPVFIQTALKCNLLSNTVDVPLPKGLSEPRRFQRAPLPWRLELGNGSVGKAGAAGELRTCQ